MKIKENKFVIEDQYRIKTELIDLLKQPSDKEERPCPGCNHTFPGTPSAKSTIHCSFKCAEAVQKMSSDPTHYPIEPNVCPIVYALYTLRLLTPCWSCEGHDNEKKQIIKMPKVWFYSKSLIYVKLISETLSSLKANKSLSYYWTVKILPYSESMLTMTYSLEPDIQYEEAVELNLLHRDMYVIGEKLRYEVHALARQYINRVDILTLEEDKDTK